MKRRGFFGALLGLPAVAKAMAEIKPVPIEVNETIKAAKEEFRWVPQSEVSGYQADGWAEVEASATWPTTEVSAGGWAKK